MKLNDPLSKYAPPGARVPTYNGTPITLVNLATHTSALPVNSPVARHRPVFCLANARATLEMPFYGEAESRAGSPGGVL